MLWHLLAVLFLLWLVYRWRNRRKFALGRQLSRKIIALPIVGHAYTFLGTDEDRLKQVEAIGRESYESGGIIAQWQGHLLYLVVTEPEIIEIVLKTCLEKDDLMRMFRVLLGNGNIFAPVSIWRPRRKILAPTFSQKNLNSFVDIFARQSKVMSDQLNIATQKGPISMWKYISTYTMDSVCETTLGINMNTQLDPELPFLQAFENCCRIDAKRICQPWLYNDTINKIFCRSAFDSYDRSKKYIWKFMDKIITSKWASLKKAAAQPDHEKPKESWKTFLELLIESSAGYGNLELREETLVIVLAGTDTSAVGSGFTTLLLAKYPEVQEKVYEELQEVFGDSDRPVTHEDLPRLKYLDAVIRESLRLYPPVPMITRKIEKDVTLPNGVTLVDGCSVIVNIWSVHRNPRYWGDDAEEFRPERFLDTPLKHPAAFVPFSYGPRSCLGYLYAMMSMKTAMATLVRRYRIKPGDGKTGKERIRVKFGIMLKPVNEFMVKLEPRTKGEK
nr:cytochrome P450 [Spodoptera frugiperda]